MKAGVGKALIHVDILVDFITGKLPVPKGVQVVNLANILTIDAQEKDKVIVFLADCHDQNNSTHFKKWPIHCLRNTIGQAFHPLLLIPDGAFVVFKGTGLDDDGYSGFDKKNVEIYIVSHRKLIRLPYTCLEQLLDDLEVLVTEIDGLATDYCDKATALDSIRLGYETRLIIDACRAVNLKPTDERDALIDMKHAGVVFTTIDEILR